MVMKTMKLQKKLSNLLIIILLFLVSANTFAGTKWEVATIFLGAHEDADFQIDIEKNLAEISKIKLSADLSIKTYREIPGKSAQRSKLVSFLKSAYKNSSSKKALIFYGHGDGPSGLRDMPTAELKSALKQLNIKVDVLWLDACFLANLEFLYEIRNASQYTIASEEAEFAAGLPFEALSELPSFENGKDAAIYLAGRFIESYSYLKNGEQRDYVSTSSATVSVVENNELESFVTMMKKIPSILAKLSVKDLSNLKNTLTKKFSMDEKSLIDLGHMLIELRLAIKIPTADKELTTMIRFLNIDSVKKLKSNPRVRIFAPTERAQMVFGFNNWENGFQLEYLSNPLFPGILNTKTFTPGPNKKNWPVKKFENNSTILTPFAPGITSFDYYFLDGNENLISEAKTVTRTHDLVEISRTQQKEAGAFLVYSAYTQQLGSKAERYTGINVTLFDTAPSMDYFEMEFNQKTRWLAL